MPLSGLFRTVGFRYSTASPKRAVDLEAQLVITHGGGLRQSDVDSLPRGPIVVDYAPQLELLSRASLTLSHAGLNTVLDSLSGVPVYRGTSDI